MKERCYEIEIICNVTPKTKQKQDVTVAGETLKEIEECRYLGKLITTSRATT